MKVSSDKMDGHKSSTFEGDVSTEAASTSAGKIQSKKLIISVHIPKTGGAAFIQILKTLAQEILYLDYGNQIFSPTALYRHGEQLREPFESITDDLQLLTGRSVIHGHFRIRKYLGRFPKASYVTWLRDPVERLASHYFFWQRSAHDRGFMDDPLCNRVISEKMSLVEFAQLDAVRNRQHEFLKPVGPNYCDFIGITEEHDRSLRLFQKLFCPGVEIRPQLNNPDRPADQHEVETGKSTELDVKTYLEQKLFSPEIEIASQLQNNNPDRGAAMYELEPGIREKIRESNELDVQTYEEGLHRFRTLCNEVGV